MSHLPLDNPILYLQVVKQAEPIKTKTTADKLYKRKHFLAIVLLSSSKSNFSGLLWLVLSLNSLKGRKLKVSLFCCSLTQKMKAMEEINRHLIEFGVKGTFFS